MDGTVKVWDAQDGTLLRTVNHAATPELSEVAYSPDGKKLAFDSGNHVEVVDAASGTALFTLAPFADDAVVVVFSPDGRRIAAGTRTGVLRIYDSNNGSLLLEFSTTHGGSDEHYFWQMAFSPDGRRLASALPKLMAPMCGTSQPASSCLASAAMARATYKWDCLQSGWQMGRHRRE